MVNLAEWPRRLLFRQDARRGGDMVPSRERYWCVYVASFDGKRILQVAAPTHLSRLSLPETKCYVTAFVGILARIAVLVKRYVGRKANLSSLAIALRPAKDGKSGRSLWARAL